MKKMKHDKNIMHRGVAGLCKILSVVSVYAGCNSVQVKIPK